MKQLFFQKPFRYTYFRATLFIVFINILVYLFGFFHKDLLNTIYTLGCLNVSNINYHHMYWQFVTYMFLHADFSHIFFNMFALLMFGISVEKVLGSKEFILFYFVTGILSGVFTYLVYLITGQYRTFLMGASGAIYAVLFAYAVIFPKSKIFIWGIIPVSAPILVLIYALIEIANEVVFMAISNVAYFTHLFGFIVAALYFIIRMRINPIKVWKEAYKK